MSVTHVLSEAKVLGDQTVNIGIIAHDPEYTVFNFSPAS
jgi:hypothetical protein